MKSNNAPDSLVRCTFESPLGPMTLAASSTGLAGVWFNDQKHMPDVSAWPVQNDHPVLLQTMAQLQAYFAGTRQTFDVPLDTRRGTPFQQLVWKTLLDIPVGQTTSYATLSQRIGKSKAMRAVGAAVGRNPISIIVPCHRVLGADGSLTGYAGGLGRKTTLLQLELGQPVTIAA